MKRHRTRSGRIADFIRGFWEDPEINMVQHKMLFPRRSMGYWQIDELKREICLRLMDQYGYQQDHTGRWIKPKVPKPRIRYKLRPRYMWDGTKYIGVYQCIIIGVLSLFFLSSYPAEATNAGGTSIVTDLYIPRTNFHLPRGSVPYVPRAIKAPSVFVIGAPGIRYPNANWPKLPREKDWMICQMQLQAFENEKKYDAMINGPRPVPHDWRKFWLWLSAIGTGAIALGSALLYGHWRSLK